jgi:hypothetical protein
MGLGLLTKGLGHLRMGVFPAWAATAGGLGTHAHDSRAPLSQAQFDCMTSPTKYTFGLAGVPAAVCHCHLGFKGAPRGASHLRSSQAYVGNLLWAGQRRRAQGETLREHEMISNREEGDRHKDQTFILFDYRW